MLADTTLEAYVAAFYGYGRYENRYWLVGMEEGGGNDEAIISRRLAVWNSRGRPELDDVLGFHRETGLDRWFRPNPPIQPTWGKLIRLLLAVQGRMVTTEAVRAYQGGQLGRVGGSVCILELLPLPSPSTDHWPYGACTRIPWLSDRNTYREHVALVRIQHLQKRIAEYTPALVVFYSLGYRQYWERITGSPFLPTAVDGLYSARVGRTVFALTRHPTHTGITNRYFEDAGACFRAFIENTT